MSGAEPVLPGTRHPAAPGLYFRRGYGEWFYGPFATPQAMGEAMAQLDRVQPYWDYDGVCRLHGCSPLPVDYVNGFPTLTAEERTMADAARAEAWR
jgi:hypothetical protein